MAILILLSHMNWLDIVIIILLIGSVIGGIMNGLIKSIFGLAGLIAGVILAGRFYVSLADHLGFISNDNTARVVAFILIFVFICVIAALLGLIFSKILSAISLGWINRFLGGLLGLLIGAIAIAAILVILTKYAGISDTVARSALGTFLVDKLPLVLGLLPVEFDTIKSYFE
jgi:membrane protein required for colicin V production